MGTTRLLRLASLACLFVGPPLSAAVSDSGYFTQNVYPVLTKAGCGGCHSPDGVASATRLHFPEADASPADVERFGHALAILIDRGSPEASLLLQKPTRRIAHAGGRRIVPGSPGEQALLTWVTYLATLPEAAGKPPRNTDAEIACRRALPGPAPADPRAVQQHGPRPAGRRQPPGRSVPLRRLRQRLQESVPVAEHLPAACRSVQRCGREAGPQRLSRRRWALADPLQAHRPRRCRLPRAVHSDFRQAGLPASPDRDRSRPATRRLFETEAAAKKSFLAGAQLVVEAMLQSPAFLSRTENG